MYTFFVEEGAGRADRGLGRKHTFTWKQFMGHGHKKTHAFAWTQFMVVWDALGFILIVHDTQVALMLKTRCGVS